jgi:hypothetical protein
METAAMNVIRRHKTTESVLGGRHLSNAGFHATSFRSLVPEYGRRKKTNLVILGVAILTLLLPLLLTQRSSIDRESIVFPSHREGFRSDHNLTIESISRVWSPPSSSGTSRYPWCHSNQLSLGLVYIKIDKASSSTLAGINIRLAHKVGAKVHDVGVCSHTKQHFRASTRVARNRDSQQLPTQRLLWTFLRNPADRAMSEYFHFWVTRRGYGVNYRILITFLESVKNFQVRYVLIPRDQSISFEPDVVLKDIVEAQPQLWLAFIDQFICRHYNFIGLVERFDESFAVMKLLWKVDLEDLIVLPAKQSGGYDDGRYEGRCIKIVKPSDFSQTSKESKVLGAIQDYLQSEFVYKNLDYLLYNAVNASLDKTISMLGTEKVDQTVRMLRLLREQVEAQCRDKAIFPCSANGTQQLEHSSKNCYWYDSGCGYPCVDKVFEHADDIV